MSGANVYLIGGRTSQGVGTGSARANLAPQPPFFQLGLIDSSKAWLTDPNIALLVVVLAHTWNHVPMAAIILLAALQAIPGELYEAAAVDRASRWRILRQIIFSRSTSRSGLLPAPRAYSVSARG